MEKKKKDVKTIAKAFFFLMNINKYIIFKNPFTCFPSPLTSFSFFSYFSALPLI